MSFNPILYDHNRSRDWETKDNTHFQQGWHCLEWNLAASSEFSAMSMYYFHNLQKSQSKIFLPDTNLS